MAIIQDKKGALKIERKAVTVDIKAVSDLVAGQSLFIEGYASTYGSPTDLDRDGEFIDAASDPFNHANGLPMFLKNPVILANHENGTGSVVGKVTDSRLDPIGLWIRVDIPDVPADAEVQRVREKIAAGTLRAFSIGGRFYREWVYDEEARREFAKITKIDLWEVSIVAIPSRQTALFEAVASPDLNSQPAQRNARSGAASATVLERKAISSSQNEEPVVKVTVRRKHAQGQVETLVIEQSQVQPGDEVVTDAAQAAAEVVESDEPTEEEIQAEVAKAAQRHMSKNAKLQAAVAQRLPAYLSGVNQGSKMVHGAQSRIGAPSVVAHVGEKAVEDYDSIIELLSDMKSGKISADQKAMRSNSGANGGYLIPDKFMETDEPRQGRYDLQDAVTTITDDEAEVIHLTRPVNDLGEAIGIAQAADKPEGDLTFERSTRAMLTLVAPLVAVANQMLRRANGVAERKVRTAFQRSMRRGREQWIINGLGNATQPTGVLREAGIGLRAGAALTTAMSVVDAVRDAMTVLEVAGYDSPSVALRPETRAAIEKSKDSGGKYLIPGVMTDGAGVLRIWSLPVINTLAIPSNLGAGTNETRVLVGDFSLAEYIRATGVLVDFSEHFGFGKNLTYFRCEEDATFQAWEHPKAFYAIPVANSMA